MHCFLRHSVFPFTQAQMLQLTEDQISPSLKILLPNLHTLISSGGTRRRHSSQQASSLLLQTPGWEHFFLHTIVESVQVHAVQLS